MLDAEEYFHLALHASAMGDHHACMTYLEEVLQREPRNARAIYLLAVQHAELGLTQRAIAGIKTALSIEPDLEIARFQLGLLLLFDKNQPAEAKDYLERLCRSPNRALRAYSEAMIAIVDNEPAARAAEARDRPVGVVAGFAAVHADAPAVRAHVERSRACRTRASSRRNARSRPVRLRCPECHSSLADVWSGARYPITWVRCYYVHCPILPRALPSSRAGSSRSGAGRTASSGDARARPSSAPARTRCRSALPGAASSTVTSTAARSAVDDDNFLILNHGQIYSTSIRALQPVESLAICFKPELAEQIYGEVSASIEQALARGDAPAERSPDFMENLHPHENAVSPVLRFIRAHISRGVARRGVVRRAARCSCSRACSAIISGCSSKSIASR